VNLANIRNGLLRVRDFPPLTAGSSKLAAAKIFIDDTSGLSIAKLRAKAGRMKREHDIRAIFIDYLQLIWSTSRSAEEDREVELAEISASLKALAKKLNVPIVVLAHLYRRPGFCTTNPEGRPRLSDLREAGSIAQDGDIVTLLAPELYFREKDEGKEEVGGKATLIIAKQRNGPIGAVPLTFLKEFTRFEDRREKGVDANGSE